MSRNKQRPSTSPAKKCECCGRIVVLLRKTDVETGTFKWVNVYAKTWDGNPYYVPHVHARHSPRAWCKRMAKKTPPKDPFFSLD